jgi:hypothetical protein
MNVQIIGEMRGKKASGRGKYPLLLKRLSLERSVSMMWMVEAPAFKRRPYIEVMS